MRCIHASHAALYFFLFFFLSIVCLFRSRSYLFTLHSCLRATFHSCLAVRRRPTPAFPPPPSSSRPLGEGSVHKGRRQKSKPNPNTIEQKSTKTRSRHSPCRNRRKRVLSCPLLPQQRTGGGCAHRAGLRGAGGLSLGAGFPPPTVHWASVLAVGVVRGACGRVCVCVFCFSQKVAEVQSRPWPAFAAPPAGERRAGPGWRPIPGGDRPRPARCLSPTGSGSRSRKPCGPHRRYRARCASRTSHRLSARS